MGMALLCHQNNDALVLVLEPAALVLHLLYTLN